jgi:peptide-methionine (S)-S-oxide reductase
MCRRILRTSFCALSLVLLAALGRAVPRDAGRPSGTTVAEAVLAGGCYWGVESVFRHVQGVQSAVSGFAVPAPRSDTPPGPPAEAVRVRYDPARLSYGQVLALFFSVVHDPTQLNRQGPDEGAEYRSIVFVANERERSAARAYIDSLTAARTYPRRIVTEIAELRSFREVDASQQNYAARHPTDPYIVANDAPKLDALRRRFPRLFRN